MNIPTILRPIDWLPMIETGYAVGYIGVPPEHPWYGKSYEMQDFPDISIHGGVTWSQRRLPNTMSQPEGDFWWIGFDTAHGDDNKFNCDKEYCEKELASLKQQALDAVK